MKKSLQRAVIITGAAGGIGTALCKSFMDDGYFVVGTSRQMPKNADFANAGIDLDLNELATNAETAVRFKASVISEIGDRSIYALVNNAAVQILGSTEDIKPSDMTMSFNVNVLAPFILTQIFLDNLTQSDGSVLNIGTVHAQSTKREFVAYSTTKTAMHGLTRALAVDLGGKVRVNTLAPAATGTPMLEAGFVGKDDAFKKLEECHPMGRIASVEEIAKTALFLCSEHASFISGATLYADGGILSRLHDPA